MVASKLFNFHMFKPKKPRSPTSSASTAECSSPPPTSLAHSSAHPTMSLQIQDPAELRKVFAKFDADSDGKISPSELDSMLHAFGDPDIEAESVMQVMDLDGDGYIQFEEFASVIRTEADEARCLEDLREAFGVYDLDRNGVITAEELHHVMHKVMRERMTLTECRRMIKAVDRNGDGSVDFEEFVGMMAQTVA